MTIAHVALATVHQEISRLRRCLGPEQFPEAKGGYQLAGTVSSDWGDFEALTEASRAVGQAESIDYLRRALSLVRGEPFAEVAPKAYGWAFDEVIVAQMETAIAGTAHVMAERCLAMGKGADAAWAVRQGLLAVPRDERLREDQLVAAAGEGGQGTGPGVARGPACARRQSDESSLGVAFRRLRSAANN